MADAVETGGGRGVTSRRRWFDGRLPRLRIAALLLAVAALASWWVYDRWRRGQVELVNTGPPLTVEVLDESGTTPIAEPFELVFRTRLSLPDGDYRVRLSGVGRLGQTYRLAVNRGASTEARLSLDGGRLLLKESEEPIETVPAVEPAPFRASTAALELSPGRADLVHAGRSTILRRAGATGAVVWDVAQPSGPNRPLRDPGPWVRAIAATPDEVTALNPPPDLNGDGVGDIVWSFHNAPGILAMSGKDGAILWHYHSEPDGRGGPRRFGPETWRYEGNVASDDTAKKPPQGQILGDPGLFDVDRDGTPDLIATVAFGRPDQDVGDRDSDAPSLDVDSRFIVAVSGRTGRRLWHAPATDETTACRINWRAALVSGRGSSTVAFVLGPRWIGLDPTTGARRGEPIDLGAEPVRSVQYADLDGDGEPELLALTPAAGAGGQALSACSLAARKVLWTVPMTGTLDVNNVDPAADWPWLVRLDGDGTTTVLVADEGPMPRGPGYRGVRRLDGRTGRTLWTRPMRPIRGVPDRRTRCLEAPDLDGDGVRDLTLARHDDEPYEGDSDSGERAGRLFVDVLSGRDGHPLWSWSRTAPAGRYDMMGTPVWWGRGPDGWPLLAVPAERIDPDDAMEDTGFRPMPPLVNVLEASTGRERHVAVGLGDPRAADLDGDGVLDLWGQVDGKTVAFKGMPPELWRAFGSYSGATWGDDPWPSGDLDGDGVGDVLTGTVSSKGGLALDPTGDPTAVARSGADGRVLWKIRLGSPWSWLPVDSSRFYHLGALEAPAGDLDGDGTVDVVVAGVNILMTGSRGLPLEVVSGRTGRVLWSAGPIPGESLVGERCSIDSSFPPLAIAIEPGSRPDLIVRSDTGSMGNDKRLTRLSGRDGRVVWSIPVDSSEPLSASVRPLGTRSPRIADLDGDGLPDLILDRSHDLGSEGTVQHPRLGLRGVSIATGRTLWTRDRELPAIPLTPGRLELNGVYDLDGDGRYEVMVSSLNGGWYKVPAKLAALDGRDGSVRWEWPPGSEGLVPAPWDGHAAIATAADDGRKAVAVLLNTMNEPDTLVVLDPRGREIARRAFPGEGQHMLAGVDLTGDGGNELIAGSLSDLRVFSGDLKPLWSRARDPSNALSVAPVLRWIMPASAGRPGLLVTTDGLVWNGPDGRPIGRGPLPTGEAKGLRCLDSRDRAQPLLWFIDKESESVCYRSLPVTEDGRPAPPRGTLTPPGLAPTDDPRWRRPLPWVIPIVEWIGPRWFLAVIALAILNLAIPLALLKLAARRRPWTIRLLLALPVAAAVPLYALHAFGPLVPAEFASIPVAPRRLYILATLAGAPLVAFAGAAGWSLIRLRWKRLLMLAALLLVSSAVVAAGWIAYDVRTMPPPAQYDCTDWPLVLVPGAAVAGSLLILGWILRRPMRWLMKPRRMASPS